MPDEGYFLFASRRLRELCEAERRFLALMRGESKPEQYIRRTSVTPEGTLRPESSGVHLRSRSRSPPLVPGPRTNTLIHLPPQPIPQEATRLKIAYVYDAVYPWVKGGVEKRIREVSVRLL